MIHITLHRAAQRGLSLVELMVSMVIGLVVVGAVFANYISNGANARQTAALAQVTDDATTAFGILRSQIAMAGYSQPSGVTSSGTFTRILPGLTVLGCEGGFDNATALVDAVTCVAAPTSANGATTPDALLVRYEADKDNTPKVTDSSNQENPSDCQGDSIYLKASLGTVPIADNRFTVDTTDAELNCSGSGPTSKPSPSARAAQPLVSNIIDMQLTYGVADTTAPGQVTRYIRADQVALAGAAGYQAAWANVVAVRVCLLVRSNDAVMEQPTAFRNCQGGIETKTNDRRMYRAFTSTVVLNNRAAF